MSTGRRPLGRNSVLIEDVPHVQQARSWDCGLACLTMILSYLKPELTDEDVSVACTRHKLGESVWTVDLAYLCSLLGIRHQFYTQTLGVDKNYAEDSFYLHNMKSTFTEEESRVNKLFENASICNVNIEKKLVTTDDILCHLESDQPVIVLINDTILRPQVGRQDDHSSKYEDLCCLWRCLFCPWLCKGYSNIEANERQAQADTEYWGHYVVIVGYDLNRGVFILNDPTIGGKHVICPFKALDEARKSFGTDEDILFLFKPA